MHSDLYIATRNVLARSACLMLPFLTHALQLAVHGWGVDVLRVVEAQPALLVSDTWQVGRRHACVSQRYICHR